MIIEVGLQKSRLITDNPELFQALQEIYSFNVPGAFYIKQKKGAHRWDGKKKYLSDAGYFKTGLLQDILEKLEKIDCYPELKYKYTEEVEENKDRFDPELRDYQVKQVLYCLNNRRCIIESPTGSGKTYLIKQLCNQFKEYSGVILFPDKTSLVQTYDFLQETDLADRVGICFGEGYIPRPIMLCTMQSIHKILDTHLDKAKFMFVDEVHKFSQGEKALAIINSFPNAEIRIGFTATIPQKDIPRYNLIEAFGPIYREVTAKMLVEEEFLARPFIQILQLKSNKKEYLSYPETYEKYVIENKFRNDVIARVCNGICYGKENARILILVKNLRHLETLGTALTEKGLKYHTLQGKDDVAVRKETIEDFIAGKGGQILLGTRILEASVNIHEITHFINARAWGNDISTIQALGRALRQHPDQNHVYIYDFIDHENYLSAHGKRRKRYYKSEGYDPETLDLIEYDYA